ncbi:MAG TPA: DNA mismatch repair endonuclease MutL [Dehalococcoidia bacterium]|nr:DNA mismatch repair endonuclease MutL [Dehalococcoidia bacterium]
MPIRVLPPEVAARIAAGEVVERPASVVKELIENALDAGASHITVEVTAGGLDSIRVSDDGCGIEPQELETAFQRHATSKLENDTDLARVLTLGFRGEALPSIAAVAEVEMVSRATNAESAARIVLTPEAPPELTSRGAPVGTTITVRRLFGRLPARRKFLRTPASESNAVAAVVSHYTLAYPEVRFALALDGKQALQTSGSGDWRDAVSAVYGAELALEMISIGEEGTLRPGSGQGGNEEGGTTVHGLIGPPHVSRASRGYISLFVNRRWIQNRRLAFAVEEAYQGLLMAGRHPVAVLNLRVPHEEVDVNMHPTKAEVRFRDEGTVFGAIQRAVRAALLEGAPVPAAGSAPALVLSPQATAPLLWQHGVNVEASASSRQLSGSSPASENGDSVATATTPAQTLPVLRVIGQMGGVYVIAESAEGMYLIDQHAAHERVLYEQFCRRRREGSPEVQGLLEPLSLDVTPRQRALLAEQAEALREHGFDIEPFGDGAFVLRSAPQSLGAGGDVREAVQRFLDTMLEEGEGDRRDRVAMSLACHGAIRAGKTLSMEEMRELVRQLEESEEPNTCPHGRPTMVHLSAEALARGFGRR